MTTLTPTTSTALEPRSLLAAFLLGFTSHATRDAYGRDIRQFSQWLERAGVFDILEANRLHVDGWARTLELEGKRPASVARKLASLASFFDFCEGEGLCDSNPVARVKRPRVDSQPSTGLDREELRSLLSAASGDGDRNHALVLLLSLAGLRCSEALGINRGDLSTERGHRVVRIGRKGGKEMLVPLAAPVAVAVDRLLEERDDEHPFRQGIHSGDHGATGDGVGVDSTGLPGTDGDLHPRGRMANGRRDSGMPLFTTSAGQRLDRFEAFRIVRRLARQAGIKAISPHSLRHSYAQIALDAGAALHDVQWSMAHSDPKTTIAYLHRMGNLDRSPTYIVAREVAE